METDIESKDLFPSERVLNPALLTSCKISQVEGQQNLKFCLLGSYCLSRKIIIIHYGSCRQLLLLMGCIMVALRSSVLNTVYIYTIKDDPFLKKTIIKNPKADKVSKKHHSVYSL